MSLTILFSLFEDFCDELNLLIILAWINDKKEGSSLIKSKHVEISILDTSTTEFADHFDADKSQKRFIKSVSFYW